MVLQLGHLTAQALKALLADLRASPTAYDLVNLHAVHLSSNGYLCLSLSDSKSLSATANHLNNPTDSLGQVDWSAVTRLKITSIGATK